MNMINLGDLRELTPEQMEARYERYIQRTRDDMKIACQIFTPSNVAETHVALGIDLLMALGGSAYAREVIERMSAALEVDTDASVN